MAYSMRGLVDHVAADLAAHPVREPMKFEAGQVVRATYTIGAPYVGVLDGERRETYHGDAWMFCDGEQAGFEDRMEILSPAPRMGDTWSNGESVARISVDSNTAQLRIVSEGEPFVGDIVAVARRLWDGGYRRVEQATKDLPWCGKALDGYVREAAKKWTERGVLAADAIKQIEWSVSGPPSTRHLAFEGLLASDPIAQAMIEDRARWDQAKREAAAEMIRAACDREAAELARHALNSATVVDTSEKLAQLLGRGSIMSHVAASSLVMSDAAAPAFSTDRSGNGNHLQQDRIDATTPQSALDGASAASRAFVTAPTLRAGMVVRDDSRGSVCAFGRVVGRHGSDIRVHWLGDFGPWFYSPSEVLSFLNAGTWTIVEPDVRPLAALAEAVAAVFSTPDRETSRRYVDIAVRGLCGEPFAAAMQAVLVAACERRDRWSSTERSPFEISMFIAGARKHERQRGIVAPGARALNDAQLRAVCLAVARRGRCVAWDIDLARIYERARGL